MSETRFSGRGVPQTTGRRGPRCRDAVPRRLEAPKEEAGCGAGEVDGEEPVASWHGTEPFVLTRGDRSGTIVEIRKDALSPKPNTKRITVTLLNVTIVHRNGRDTELDP